MLSRLAEGQRDCALTDLSSSLKIDKSSAFRVLETMVEMGFVEKDPQTKRYRVGPRFRALTPGSYEHIKYAAHATLIGLSQELGVTVALRIQESSQMLVIDRVESNDLLRVSFPIGFRHSITFGSSGRVFLAFLPQQEAKQLVEMCGAEERGRSRESLKRDMKPTQRANSDNSPSSAHTQLWPGLKRTRERGYEVGREVVAMGTTAVSIPLLATDMRPIAVLSLSWPTIKHPKSALMRIVRSGLDAAREISKKLAVSSVSENVTLAEARRVNSRRRLVSK